MALELQNEEQQRIISDNLSIAASNRLATGYLSTQESKSRLLRHENETREMTLHVDSCT